MTGEATLAGPDRPCPGTIASMTDSIRASIGIPDFVRRFLEEPHLTAVATLDPDGAPRQAVTWYLFRDDEIVINSRVGRRWPTNLVRDPRTALAIADAANTLRWIGITGRATEVRDQAQAQADIAEMARRYNAADPEVAERRIREQFTREERISFRIAIEAIHDHLS
jgi:PPOX class probable F420-dependent enzyme